MKREPLKDFFKWFFTEEPADDNKEGDTIEIGMRQIVIAVLTSILLMVWIFGSYIQGYIDREILHPGMDIEELIGSLIEKDYFAGGNSLTNGDFSQGMDHWATSDGGQLFPQSKSRMFVDNNIFYSSPGSLKIETISPASRLHYLKIPGIHKIHDAYGFRETDHWLGVNGQPSMQASCWYKGDTLRFAVNGLLADGSWKSLAVVTGQASENWKKLNMDVPVGEDVRAVALEFTLNQAQGMPLPAAWIDDVDLKIKPKIKQ